MSEILNDVKAGDEIALWYSGGGGRWQIAAVDKVLSKWLLIGGNKYRIAGGRRVDGGAWESETVNKLTPSIRRQIDEWRAKRHAQTRRRFLHDWPLWRDMPDADVKEIWDHVERLKAARVAGGAEGAGT